MPTETANVCCRWAMPTLLTFNTQENVAMNYRNSQSWTKLLLILALTCLGWSAARADDAWYTPPAKSSGEIVLKVVMVEDEDENPAAAGKQAAKALEKAMGSTPLKAVIVSECFEDRQNKEKLLSGICSVLPKEIVLGGATYGSFTQKGCTDFDSVCLLGIGGDGVAVAAGLVTNLGTAKLLFEDHRELIEKRLRAGGEKLAAVLRKTDNDQLLVLIPDAHSPKSQYMVEGTQKVLGNQFPITGGCANKNAGQTFVYFRGKAHEDSAVGVLLSGNFKVSLSGRMAKDNEGVIRSANEGAAEAMANFKGKPAGVLAFNCAGRRSKLKNFQDELDAIQKAIGKQLPLFGCYCAGEIGPVDSLEEKKPGVLSRGSGWHVMFTVIGR